MLLKRIELLLDPRIDELGIVVKYNDGKIDVCKPVYPNDGDRVEIYEGLTVSRRTLED